MKNWKTSLIGLGIGAGNLAIDMLGSSHFNLKSFLFSVGIGALGLVAKDSNVTGGTVHQ
jgi:hypothetical protein